MKTHSGRGKIKPRVEERKRSFPEGDETRGWKGGRGRRDSRKRAERREDLVNLSVVIRGRNRRRGQIPSRASPSFANQLETYTPADLPSFFRAGDGWLVRWLAACFVTTPPPSYPRSYPSTGVSHCGWPEVAGSPEPGIFMRAHPADRGITRNKEIANLLRAHPFVFLPCTRLLPPPTSSLILSEQGGRVGGSD